MLSKSKIKEKLKKNAFLYGINMRWKAFFVKRRYSNLRRYYEKIAIKHGIKYREEDVPNQVSKLLKQRGIHPRPLPKGTLRIFYVGANYDQDFGGIIQGLRKFGKVVLFECEPGRYGQIPSVITKNRAKNSGQRLIDQMQETLKFGPISAIIGQMCARTMEPCSLEVVRQMGIPVVNISMDDRHKFCDQKINDKWTGVVGLTGSIDLACTTAPECCLWYTVEGCPAIYLPEASDPELYKPSSTPKLYDVSFVGANYGIRAKIVKAIERRGINVTCYGNGWPNGRISVEKLPELFACSRIVLGVGTIGHCTDFYSLKMRDFDGPMSGSLHLTHDNPDLCGLFDVGKEIITYRTPEECADKVLYYLEHPNEAESIGKAGRKRAVREHTWRNRFDKIFRTVGIIQ